MNANRVQANVDFFADFLCPWCYLGWNALKQAASEERERAALTVIWRTFLIAPDMPLEGKARAEPQSEKTLAARQALIDGAHDLGVPLNLDAAARIPNTLRAHRLVHLASHYGEGEGVIDAVFNAYFIDGAPIDEIATLVGIGEAHGLDPQELAEALAIENFSDLLGMHEAAVKIGMRGAPVAVFNRRAPILGAQSVETYREAIRAAR